MAIFGDLAIELQEAIWKLVLPTSRGVHWVEVEGIPQEADFIRDSIRMTQWCRFDRMPASHSDVYHSRQLNPEFSRRAEATQKDSSPFFSHLLTTLPAAIEPSEGTGNEQLESDQTDDLADEITFTSRCRQLSTYYQVSTLLSLCRLSRSIALQYIRSNHKCSWPIRRSMGPLYRPRPIEVWESQYSGDISPPVSLHHKSWQLLRTRIHTLDLIVFRLHDSHGRATSLLKHAPWQYYIEQPAHDTTFACFDRIGLEWHPSWGTFGGRNELRSGNIGAFVNSMQGNHFPARLYWLVDGVPRPNWNDYPAVVHDIFASRLADDRDGVSEHLDRHWKLGARERRELLADCHLGQEFEANGRRYYIVFVVFSQFLEEEREKLNKAGVDWSGPFPGNALMWPQALREPVRLAYDVCGDGSSNLGTLRSHSCILSWEPIS